MEMIDPAGEFLRITERYRQMSDEELLLLIPQSSDLTDVAQQALATEIRSRGLKTEGNVEVEQLAAEKLKVENEKPSALRQGRPPAFVLNEPAQSHDSYGFDSTPGDLSEEASAEEFRADESPYDEDRKLIELCTVWSLSDALKLQSVLDNAGIPFFIGPEKATGVDAVTSDFSDGLSVQVMLIGFPWARQAMKNYYPEDHPPPQE